MTTVERRVPYFTITICVGVMAAIAGAIVYFWPAMTVLFDPARTGRQFYLPSGSMRPTLEVNERVVPLRVTSGALRRGVIIVFHGPSDVRIDRIAALGGDTVALKDGVVVLNGQPTPQRLVGTGPTVDGEATHQLLERFSEEGHWHRILDAGVSDGDNWGPLRVPANMLFVLGDNRDRAADSRFPPDRGGVSMIPVSVVIGVVDTISWSARHGRIGRPIDAVTLGGRAS